MGLKARWRRACRSREGRARSGRPAGANALNDVVFERYGPRTIVAVNGQKVTDYTEGQPVPERRFDFEPQRGRRPDKGWFGLQNHSKDDVVFYKEVAMKSLKK